MLSAHALTTIETLRDELMIDNSQDAYLTRLINAASDAIRSYCDRSFARAQVTEAFTGTGQKNLLLTLFPIIQIESVAVDGRLLPEDEYRVLSESGMLEHQSGWSGDIAVVYTGGYVTPAQAEKDDSLERDLPWDLEEACIVTASTWAAHRGTPRDATTLQVEQIRVTFGERDRAPALLPAAVQNLLHPWRRLV